MRILFVHNYYQQRGGEDGVFEQEVRMLREHGFMVETVEFTNDGFDESIFGNLLGAIRSLYNNQSIARIEQAIDKFRPNVVHIHNLFYTASPSVIKAAKNRGIPVVMTLHNYRLVCNSGMLSREEQVPCERCLAKTVPLDGIRFGCFRNSRPQSAQLTAITSLHKLTGIWRSVDKFIVLTDFARKKILQSSLHLKPEQVVVKPNYIEDLGFSDQTFRQNVFVYIGRLHYEKGIQSLIEASYLHHLPLEIIGDGPLRPLVEKAARELPHVIYNGFLPRNEGLERMKQCRAIIVPSIWYEGLPTTILEAFTTGTPVLCSDQGNLNTIVQAGITGLLFKTGDPISIASTMMSLSDEECVRYAHEGRKEYQQLYSRDVVLQKQTDIYSQVTLNTKLPIDKFPLSI